MAASKAIQGDKPPDALTRVQDLWFDDHVLVLQAGNRLFREGVNPLDVMNPVVWTTLSPNLCAPCYLAAETEHRAAREKVWAALSSVFGLEPWEEVSTAPQM
ncbi:hypothetical protein B0H10DRAFT_2236869 [Mycena sp. CBHHK59/15]|nr:hypothetical protein B0H10DRAFT_2236869 [Mycena sp. CBHHK59/15]